MLVALALLAVVTVALPLVGCKNDTVAEQTGDGTGSGDGNQGTGDQGSGSGNQGSGDPEQPVTYTVSFKTNEGSTVPSQTVERGKTATKPADPTLENNVFDGWYSDAEFSKSYDFTTPVTGSFTLYAKWVERIEVTADYVSTVISGLTGDGSYILVVTGELNDLSAITTALNEKPTAKVNLDLSEATRLTSIGNYAFQGCDSLTSISIPSSVTSIGHFAFNGCSGLTSIDLSKATGLTAIEAGTFQGCSGLTSISIPEGVEFIVGDAFRGCSGLTSISIPSSVTSIGGDAFFGCYSLTSIDLSKATGLTTIGNYAFEGCRGLTSISIPSSVEIIGNVAFFGCSSLEEVTMEANTPPTLGIGAFDETAGNLQILVPNVVNYTNEDAKEKGWEPYKDKIKP